MPKTKQKKLQKSRSTKNTNKVTKTFQALSRVVSKRPALSIAVAVVLIGTGYLAVSSALTPRATTTAAPQDLVVAPFDRASFGGGIPVDAEGVRLRTILNNANKYALTTWWSSTGYSTQTQYYLTLNTNTQREAASEALALASSIATGAYNPAVTGVSEAQARSVAVKLVRSVAYSHGVNKAGGWANDWQTAIPAGAAGQAGWMLWNDMPATDREYVRKMVEYEANRFIGYKIPYWKTRTGAYMGICGDSKAEENSWNAQLLMLAPTMMPQHTRRSGWIYKSHELLVGSYAKPADLASNALVMGRPLNSWLDGTNINNDGTLVNHRMYHPDYMSTVTQNMAGSVVKGLAHQPAPQSALQNINVVYSALVQKNFVPAPARPCTDSPAFAVPAANNPNGKIYVPGSDEIYYPEGADTGYGRRMHFAELDVMAKAFGMDNLVTIAGRKAADWEIKHNQKMLSMQARFTDGRTYASGEDLYSGREEWVAREAGQAWLTKWLSSKGGITVNNASTQILLDDNDRLTTYYGSWTVGNPTGNGPQVYGPTVRYKAPGTGAAVARFSPRSTINKQYRIYTWWVASSGQATNTPYKIIHAGGTTMLPQNQRVNGGKMNYLGTFTMRPGDYVEINDKANGYVVADAVLFDPVN